MNRLILPIVVTLIAVVALHSVPVTGQSQDNIGVYKGVSVTDTVSESSLEKEEFLLRRSVARVEQIRGIDVSHNIKIEDLLNTSKRGSVDIQFRQWNNAVWLALHVVPRSEDSTSQIQQLNRKSTTAIYSYSDDTVYVRNNTIPHEAVLGHEVVHAIQDNRYSIGETLASSRTQDSTLAARSLAEGDAQAVERKYRSLCTREWNCTLSENKQDTRILGVQDGIISTIRFPYTTGERYYRNSVKGQEKEVYANPPDTTRQILYGKPYNNPPEINTDEITIRWQKISPSSGVNGKESVGPLGVSLLLWQLSERDSGIAPVNNSQIYRYNSELVQNLTADSITPVIHVQTQTTGYVFTTRWETAADAREFASEYTRLAFEEEFNNLQTYKIETGGFSGIYTISQDNNEVTISYSSSSTTPTPVFLSNTESSPTEEQSITSIILSEIQYIIAALIVLVSLYSVIRK